MLSSIAIIMGPSLVTIALETYLENFVKDTIALANAVHTDYLETLA